MILLSLSYIVGEDKSFEEPPGNRDEGVERVEVSARQEGKISFPLTSNKLNA